MDVPAWATRLRDARRERCWAQKEVVRRLVEAADDLHVSAHMPKRESLLRMLRMWEQGQRHPSDPYPQLLAKVFGTSEAKLFGPEEAIMNGPSLPSSFSASRGGHVAPELVDYFRLQLLSHYAADAYLGPRHLIGTVTVQYQSIVELAALAEPDVRRGLLRLGGGYAAFAGWLYQDAGALDQAAAWVNVNLEMAHRAQDVQLVSHALTNTGMLAADLGDASAVIDLAAAALANRRELVPKAQVLALQQGAHGYALAADRERCDDMLDQAAGLIDDIGDDDRMWGNACRTPRYVEIQRATCYGRLGLHADAVDLWDQIIPSMPTTSRRDVGVFLARQAGSLAAVSEAERATDLAEKAADILRHTNSARQRSELFAISGHMKAWANTGKAREMTEILASVDAGEL
jgi:tetratricopeptide (TPR) repeat protein